ncbi:Rv3235 family protein [Subtercola sp. YIM 133946]|uniref:Rv3235 family protein n=1 Tax=Subtercola sp. YIM 133946 TaxID=3118909 RepID=UPI002F93F903
MGEAVVRDGAAGEQETGEGAARDDPGPVEFVERLTWCVLEVLAGVRDLDQLGRWVTDEVYKNLSKRVTLSSRARQVRGQRTVRPTFSIGRVLLSEPAPAVFEGVVIVHGKARTRAVALRVERWGSRWRASAINVL